MQTILHACLSAQKIRNPMMNIHAKRFTLPCPHEIDSTFEQAESNVNSKVKVNFS